MKFLFRADAATAIGTGHVVRCATLAGQLSRQGHDVTFLARECTGNLNGWLADTDFQVQPLPADMPDETADAAACLAAIADRRYDWLVVDHYGLGPAWEEALADCAERRLAIDDLGRSHSVDLLLDQNFANPLQARYAAILPASCRQLLGPAYALVRPHFAALRSAALARRHGQLERLLLCLGGSDAENETSKILAGLARSHWNGLAMDIVIGAGNPHRAEVKTACRRLPRAQLHVQTDRMAELMAAADCAITAGGSTAWERCTLGLPGLVTTVADNQIAIAQAMDAAGGHLLLGWYADLEGADYVRALDGLDSARLVALATTAATICDGQGAARVAASLTH